VTVEQIHEIAVAIVERSTAAQGLPFHVTDPAVLDVLAGAVVQANTATPKAA
jgi:hypothetical protein